MKIRNWASKMTFWFNFVLFQRVTGQQMATRCLCQSFIICNNLLKFVIGLLGWHFDPIFELNLVTIETLQFNLKALSKSIRNKALFWELFLSTTCFWLLNIVEILQIWIKYLVRFCGGKGDSKYWVSTLLLPNVCVMHLYFLISSDIGYGEDEHIHKEWRQSHYIQLMLSSLWIILIGYW